MDGKTAKQLSSSGTEPKNKRKRNEDMLKAGSGGSQAAESSGSVDRSAQTHRDGANK